MHRIPIFGAKGALSTCVFLLLGLLCASRGFGADSPLELDQYRGQVVVVDFWASWCVPCRRSFPWLNRMQEKYREDGLVIVGVNLDSSAEDAQSFLREFPAEFSIVFDPDAALAQRFDVAAMPTSFVLDRNGEIVANHLGFKVRDQDEYERIIREALGPGTE